MKVRVTAYLGNEGFADRFLGERDKDGLILPCSIRWAPEVPGESKDNRLARVRDAGLLLKRYPDPLIPRVHAVVPAWGGVAVLADQPEGISLKSIPTERRPVPEKAVLEIVRQVAELLTRLYNLPDPATGKPLHILHRALTSERIHVDPNGTLKVVGFDQMHTSWSFRSAETGVMTLHPGARLAPEQMAGQAFHTTDVYLLGLVAMDALAEARAATRFSRELAMCICDSDEFVRIRDSFLRTEVPGLSVEAQGLLAQMLQEDPKARPDARTVARRAADLGASATELARYAARLPPEPPPETEDHDFVGRILKVEMDPTPARTPRASRPEPTASAPAVPAAPPAPAAAPRPVTTPVPTMDLGRSRPPVGPVEPVAPAPPPPVMAPPPVEAARPSQVRQVHRTQPPADAAPPSPGSAPDELAPSPVFHQPKLRTVVPAAAPEPPPAASLEEATEEAAPVPARKAGLSAPWIVVIGLLVVVLLFVAAFGVFGLWLFMKSSGSAP